MFAVDLVTFSAVLLFGALVLSVLVVTYYSRRERLWNDHRRHSTVFHCIRCGKIYQRSRIREESVCPRCGLTNSRLKF